MIPTEFHFLRPAWLWMFLPLLGLVWYLIRNKQFGRNWEKICDPQLLPFMLIKSQTKQRSWHVALIFIAGILAIIALAGPTWERLPQPVFKQQSALVVILDLSQSMNATDVTPSRLDRARFKLADILKSRNEGEVALIAYAAEAFTVTPLTDDNNTILSQLPALTTDLMPAQGYRADLALQLAGKLMAQAGHVSGDILLITDEVDPHRDVDMATQILEQGYRVSVLGIGTEQGTPITIKGGGFLKDHKGNIVIPVLNEVSLQKVAMAGGGIYRTLTVTDEDINAILSVTTSGAVDETVNESRFKSDQWQEQGPWLLLLLIPIAALGFRRGILMALCFFILPFPQGVQAFSWDDLWLNEDQKGSRLLEQGKPAEAANVFNDPRWRSAAEYQSGNYDASLQALADQNDLESLYNKGNALARLGRYNEAISQYEQVLEQNPGHEDASYNRDLLKKLLEQQQQAGQGSAQDQQSTTDSDQDKQSDQTGEGSAADQHNTEQGKAGESESQQDQTDAQADAEQGSKEQDGEMGDEDLASETERNNNTKEDKQSAGHEQEQTSSTDDTTPQDETELASEQWLRRIPDDPGGLLRRKFLYQYNKKGLQQSEQTQRW